MATIYKSITMTPEQKAKRYDETLEQLRGLIEGTREDKCAIVEEDIIHIFSELKESEDERIRTAIIHFISHTPTVPKGIIGKETMLAWLEKQAKLVEEYEDRLDRCACESFNKGYKAAIEHQKEKQGEQKPAWCPSKKQLEALKDLLDYNIGVFDYQKFMEVNSLYDNLTRK